MSVTQLLARIRPAALILAAVLAALGGGAPARAQDLAPETVARTPALNPEDVRLVGEYVKGPLSDLGDTSTDRVTRARTALTKPLASPQASVAFRQEYSRQVAPRLKELLAVKDQRDVVRVNALRLAGELATPEGLDLIDSSLANESKTVRYAAAFALGRAMDSLQLASPAVVADRVRETLNRAGQRIEAESETTVLDALVRAFCKGGSITRDAARDVRPAALSILSRSLSARLRQAKATETNSALLDSVLRALGTLRDELTAGGGRPALAAGVKQDAGGLAGDTIAIFARMLRADPTPLPQVRREDDDAQQQRKRDLRVQPQSLVTAAEVVITAARGGEPATRNLAARLASASSADDARFIEELEPLLAAGGVMTKEPFNFAGDRFPTR